METGLRFRQMVEDWMTNESNAPFRFSRLDYSVEVLARSDGSHLALFVDEWRAKTTTRDHPDVVLEALPAGGS